MPDEWAPAPQVPPAETRVEPDRHPAEARVELCPVAVPAPVADSGGGAPDPSTALDEWHQLVRSLQLRGMPRELANHCDLVALEGGRVALRLAPVHKPLLSAGNQDKLAQALGQALGRTVSVAIELAEPQGETLAQRLRTEDRERRDAAIQAIEGDPFVQELINLFDAELNESSIRPL